MYKYVYISSPEEEIKNEWKVKGIQWFLTPLFFYRYEKKMARVFENGTSFWNSIYSLSKRKESECNLKLFLLISSNI